MSLPRTKLLKRVNTATNTMSFQFEKPKGFTYVAGQFADYTLLNPTETDTEGNIRGFTLSSAPYEPYLMATTRMRDTAFKRVLKTLELGTELELDAPYGDFTLHEDNTKPAVFLTGGIGITPVRSIVLQSIHDQTGHQFFIFDSNNHPDDIAFYDELTQLAKDYSEVTFVPTITDIENSSQTWSKDTGFITRELIEKHVNTMIGPIYYLCGPESMVKAMRKLLNDAGVPAEDVITEEFSGY